MSQAILQASKFPGIARSASVAATVSMALLLGACAQDNALNLTLGDDKPKVADIATSSAGERPEAELEKATAYWGEQFNKNPRDPKAAIAFARNLKALGRKAQALGVMQASYMHSPDNKEFLSEYGRLALDMGQVSTAGELLARAEDPAKPDWKIISARGTVLAKQGRYKEAVELFEKARSLAPDQASVLNNLAMAYTLNGEAARGEELLRQAAGTGTTDPRVKQNLALVMDLQGKAAGQSKPAEAAASATPTASAAAPQVASWSRALPTEIAAAKPQSSKSKAQPTAAAAKPLDPDEVMKQALKAEQAKRPQQ